MRASPISVLLFVAAQMRAVLLSLSCRSNLTTISIIFDEYLAYLAKVLAMAKEKEYQSDATITPKICVVRMHQTWISLSKGKLNETQM